MANFEISAPGRIILSGEHSAIHEKNVVATSLNLRTTLKFFELSDKSNVRIEFPNVNLELNIPLEEIRCVPTVIGRKVSNPVILLNYVKHLITVNDMWETDEQKFSLQIFFFLLYSIIYNERFKIRPFCLRVFSNIPIGSGLGSSTSFAICIASCFFHLKRLQQNNDRIELNTDELLSIKRYIIFCESVMQDYAFVSLDACACLFGQILLCTRINSAEKISMRRMEHIRKIKILLINSNIRQNYAEQVKQMKTVKRIFPEFNILNRFDEISNKIYSTIMDMNSPEYVISVEHQKRLYNELKVFFFRLYNELKEIFIIFNSVII